MLGVSIPLRYALISGMPGPAAVGAKNTQRTAASSVSRKFAPAKRTNPVNHCEELVPSYVFDRKVDERGCDAGEEPDQARERPLQENVLQHLNFGSAPPIMLEQVRKGGEWCINSLIVQALNVGDFGSDHRKWARRECSVPLEEWLTQ